ncbi:hypothetical protein ABZP36_034750 [Zizania latifolia]
MDATASPLQAAVAFGRACFVEPSRSSAAPRRRAAAEPGSAQMSVRFRSLLTGVDVVRVTCCGKFFCKLFFVGI